MKTPPKAGPVEQLAVLARYESFISYTYPIAQNIPRKHGVARDRFLGAMFEQVELFVAAGKSNQPSRLYSADAGLGVLRFWLRFMADDKYRLITPHQHQVASIHLAEVGAMLGAWIKSVRRGGKSG